MSHFVVLVIGENVEEQLRPYDENTTNPELLTFVDEEGKSRRNYDTDTIDAYIDRQGKFCYFSDSHAPTWAKHLHQPAKELFKTFEEYMTAWCGMSERDPKTGRYGYYTNPNKKWDWYTEGGRWPDYFPLRSGGHSTSAFKQDIDFERARKDAEQEAVAHWDKVNAVVAGRGWPPPWAELYEHYKEDLTTARAIYNDHPVIKDLYKADLLYPLGDETTELRKSREEYASRARAKVLVPYAIVRDSKWYARGEMGWWGISRDEKEDEIWINEVSKLFDSLSDDTRLTVIDCHI